MEGMYERTHPHYRRRLPYVGDVLTVASSEPVVAMLDWAGDLRPTFETKFFGRRMVFVSGAMLAAEMCDVQRFEKAVAPQVRALREFVGDGLFTAYNDEPNWQLAHSILMPAFTKGAMRSYHDTMVATTDELFAYWARGDGPIDVSRDMTKLTLETLTRTSFGRDFGSFDSVEPHPFVRAMVRALKTGRSKAVLDAVPGGALVERRVDAANRQSLEYVTTLVDDLISERRASGDDRTDDLLGLMLNSACPNTGEHLDDENIRYQILTFLVAGHETTSGAISLALYHLAHRPDLIRRAQEETDAVLGADRDVAPTYEQVSKFRFIRHCLDEALRIWPTVPGFARSPRQTTEVGGMVMRPDEFAIVVLPLVHRDPEVWPDPLRFDPDRFTPDQVRNRPAHTYIPFGIGDRACIGRQFGLHEAVLLLARLFHRYDIAPDPGYDLRVSERLTLMPKGFELTLTPRSSMVGVA